MFKLKDYFLVLLSQFFQIEVLTNMIYVILIYDFFH
jgi:hypothetical protein